MRALVLFAWITFVAGSFVDPFDSWVLRHGKTYASAHERAYRRNVFERNAELVNEANRDSEEIGGGVFGLGPYADMTEEEFRATILMPKRRAPKHPSERVLPTYATDDLPKSFDWREKGVVTPVKDQGSVGSCWAFSTVGNIEGQWALSGHNLTSFSEEQLVDCDGEKDPSKGVADCAVFGGWPFLAYQYVISAGGIETESQYPYCAGNGGCYPCPVKGWNVTLCGPPVEYCNATKYPCRQSKSLDAAHIDSWAAFHGSEDELAATLMQRGPLSILIDASGLQFHHSGIWDPMFCSSTDLDHAVLLVGFGEEKTLFGTKKYWIVKNSWGVKWGEKGYFRMIRGKNKCGITAGVTTSIIN